MSTELFTVNLEAENERLHNLHLERTRFTTKVLNELDDAKAEIERLRAERDHYRDKYFAAQAENERLREALDKACESSETSAQVGRGIDYQNGFERGKQTQRMTARAARAEALAALEPHDEAVSAWQCSAGHDFSSRGDGTAKCTGCGEIVDISETGAAR